MWKCITQQGVWPKIITLIVIRYVFSGVNRNVQGKDKRRLPAKNITGMPIKIAMHLDDPRIIIHGTLKF